MNSWILQPSKVMGDTYKYQEYVVNVRRKNNKSRRSYASFGDVCFEIEFIEACSHNFFIFLSRVVIMRIKVEDMKKTCW